MMARVIEAGRPGMCDWCGHDGSERATIAAHLGPRPPAGLGVTALLSVSRSYGAMMATMDGRSQPDRWADWRRPVLIVYSTAKVQQPNGALVVAWDTGPMLAHRQPGPQPHRAYNTHKQIHGWLGPDILLHTATLQAPSIIQAKICSYKEHPLNGARQMNHCWQVSVRIRLMS